MAQITLYLDDATQALVEQAAKANGVSKSRWVADIIRTYAAHDWPQDCLALAGQFPDFPLLLKCQKQKKPQQLLLNRCEIFSCRSFANSSLLYLAFKFSM